MNGVPVSVAELELRARLEDGGDGAAAVVHGEGHRAVLHLQQDVVSSTFKNARGNLAQKVHAIKNSKVLQSGSVTGFIKR